MLADNKQCTVLTDFTKAFDMVDHVILARKLYRLQVPVFIIQWIMSFLSDRTQATRLGFHLSTQLSINRCKVLAGIGPILFTMFIHDLKPLDILNYLLKYAFVSSKFQYIHWPRDGPRHRLGEKQNECQPTKDGRTGLSEA